MVSCQAGQACFARRPCVLCPSCPQTAPPYFTPARTHVLYNFGVSQDRKRPRRRLKLAHRNRSLNHIPGSAPLLLLLPLPLLCPCRCPCFALAVALAFLCICICFCICLALHTFRSPKPLVILSEVAHGIFVSNAVEWIPVFCLCPRLCLCVAFAVAFASAFASDTFRSPQNSRHPERSFSRHFVSNAVEWTPAFRLCFCPCLCPCLCPCPCLCFCICLASHTFRSPKPLVILSEVAHGTL